MAAHSSTMPYAASTLRHGITLEHLLTMRSGLACDDRDPASPGQEDRMYQERDWVRYFLELPVAAPAGTVAHYCTGGVVALGRVVAEASKQPIPTFANAVLFGPLGISNARWADFDAHRQTDTGGHLALRPRDMAKIGQLVLQGACGMESSSCLAHGSSKRPASTRSSTRATSPMGTCGGVHRRRTRADT
ncbi:hypothetical protein CJO94_03795 [Ralstonia solanacearum]|nr:hypothetical protein CJO94_03795 [Ralstonia solanacearum]